MTIKEISNSGLNPSELNETNVLHKTVIAVDVDEVLCYFVQALVSFYNRVYVKEYNEGKKSNEGEQRKEIKIDMFHSYHFTKNWEHGEEETQDIVNKFFQSNEFKNQEQVDGAFEVLKRLKEKYCLIVVTSRQHFLKKQTEETLEKYFPNVFSGMLMGNHYGENGSKASKPEMCDNINAELLIDDSTKYVTECVEHGHKAILFGEYPWNKTIEQKVLESGLMRRVSNWKQIEEAIEELLKN